MASNATVETLDKDLLFEFAKKTKGTFAAEIIFTVLLNVLLFSLFILFFFFVIASKVEQTVVKTSVTDLVKSFSDELKFVMTEDQIREVAALLQKAHLPDMKAIDQSVKDANAKLIKQALIVLGSTAAVVGVVILVSYFVMKTYVTKHSTAAMPGINYPDMGKVLRLCLYSFIAVIVTEMVFLYTMAAQFQPLDQNKVKLSIIQYMQSLATPPPKQTK